MNSFRRGCCAVATTVVIIMGGIVVSPSMAQAAETLPYTARYTANANGAIITVGNTLLTCPTSDGNCTAARQGGKYTNNDFSMVNLDADSDPATFNSSMATLSLPPGANVLWAGLYWSAQLSAASGDTASDNYNMMSLQLPGETSYRTISANAADSALFGPTSASNDVYQRYADVTALVQTAGSGDYWGANVVSALGTGTYAAWSLVVAYSAPDLPLRNLTVFDGFSAVGPTTAQTVTVSGIQTPAEGTVSAQLSMVAYISGTAPTSDGVSLNGTPVSTEVSPATDFFNSTSDTDGVSTTARKPDDQNLLGVDIKNLTVSGSIPTSATSATVEFTAADGSYLPGILATTIDIATPPAPAQAKTVEQLAQEVIQGDWGVGLDRQTRLTEAGFDYDAVQNQVNAVLGATPSSQSGSDQASQASTAKSSSQSGSSAAKPAPAPQPAPAASPTKSLQQVAQEVISGAWGSGADRQARLAAAGYDYTQVQAQVNAILGSQSSQPASSGGSSSQKPSSSGGSGSSGSSGGGAAAPAPAPAAPAAPTCANGPGRPSCIPINGGTAAQQAAVRSYLERWAGNAYIDHVNIVAGLGHLGITDLTCGNSGLATQMQLKASMTGLQLQQVTAHEIGHAVVNYVYRGTGCSYMTGNPATLFGGNEPMADCMAQAMTGSSADLYYTGGCSAQQVAWARQILSGQKI